MRTTTVVAIVSVIALAAIIVMLVWDRAPDSPGDEVCDLMDNDGDGTVDEGFTVTCAEDADCGPSGFFGDRYCKDGDVWQGYYASSCESEVGTCLSECSSKQAERIVESCDGECQSGRCV